MFAGGKRISLSHCDERCHLCRSHVSQGEEHPDQKQRVGAVQQPQRAAHRPAASHLLHGCPRKRCQHGERLMGWTQLLPPAAAVQGAQCGHQHVAHHAGECNQIRQTFY